MPTEIYAALLGALAGAIITYLFGVKLAEAQFMHALQVVKYEQRLLAEGKFRASFASEIARFRMNPEAATEIFLEQISKHAAAIEEFLPHVAVESRTKYRELANDYLYPSFVDKHLRRLSHDDLSRKIDAILEFSTMPTGSSTH